MTFSLPDINVLFVAGFGPIAADLAASRALYLDTLRLPLKPLAESGDYLVADTLGGVKHFALWPLAQASQSCFGTEHWPEDVTVPQSWLEFEVEDMATATAAVKQAGYVLLVDNRLEPWGQSVTRFLSPEGILVGVTHTPWLRSE
ncbi:MAG: glyoxalase [Symbiopectobacterium sp.]|uniref:glyoxalase n=1 Tax=Symbiopectobacterium sp. TaxID=2952789 RepID=UPI0039E96DC9